jgi:hypothetical protein
MRGTEHLGSNCAPLLTAPIPPSWPGTMGGGAGAAPKDSAVIPHWKSTPAILPADCSYLLQAGRFAGGDLHGPIAAL